MQNLHAFEPSAAMPAIALAAPAGAPSSLVAPAQTPGTVLPPLGTSLADRALPPILVADDDPDDRFFIQRLIGKTGTKNPVRCFDDGSEVVNYLGAIAAASADIRARAPRLLFLDLNMAGLGGFGFLEWARQQKNALPLTIVVLSNSAETADVQRAHELGAHRYLVKYPSVHTFSTIVRAVYPFTLAP